jgi:hypothetical protein
MRSLYSIRACNGWRLSTWLWIKTNGFLCRCFLLGSYMYKMQQCGFVSRAGRETAGVTSHRCENSYWHIGYRVVCKVITVACPPWPYFNSSRKHEATEQVRTLFGRYPVLILSGLPCILAEGFRVFSPSSQANSVMVPYSRPWPSPFTSFLVILSFDNIIYAVEKISFKYTNKSKKKSL